MLHLFGGQKEHDRATTTMATTKMTLGGAMAKTDLDATKWQAIVTAVHTVHPVGRRMADGYAYMLVRARPLVPRGTDGVLIPVPWSHWQKLWAESTASNLVCVLIDRPQSLLDHTGFGPGVKYLHASHFDLMWRESATTDQTYTIRVNGEDIQMVTSTAGLTFHPGTHATQPDDALEEKKKKKKKKKAEKKKRQDEKQQEEARRMAAFWDGE